MFTRREKKMPQALGAGIFCLAVLAWAAADAPRALSAPADHLVINEVQIDSLIGAGGTDDDWVEIYNPTAAPIALDGWSVQKTTGTGGTLVRVPLAGTIAARGYWLIVRNGATTNPDLANQADTLASDNFSLAANNIVYLANNNENITGADDENIIDRVGWGTAENYEGAGPAPAITEAKSISRTPDGEDTDDNQTDFTITNPTPRSSAYTSEDNGLDGEVLFTLILADPAVSDLTPVSATINFSANSAGSARAEYGLSAAYGQSTPAAPITAGASAIGLTGLACGTEYHFTVNGQDESGAETDATLDATFTTLPCGLRLDGLAMTKTGAKAKNNYEEGWEWQFALTIWDAQETRVKMKFQPWTGPNNALINAGGQMRFSANAGASWVEIGANNEYPGQSADVSGLDLSAEPGRQINIIVQMKVPLSSPAGHYTSAYGLLTE